MLLGIAMTAPAPARGGGGARSAGGVGSMRGVERLCVGDRGGAKAPPRQPHPHGESHHGPQYADMSTGKV